MSAARRVGGGLGAALWVNLALVYVLWGSTYFGIAIAIETIPPFLMAAIRFGIAGVILITFDVVRHPEARRLPSRRELLDSAIVGGLLLGVGNGFVTYAELTVPTGIAAILIAMVPLWFALLGWLYLRERLPRVVGFAVALGFAGTALLVWPSDAAGGGFEIVGIIVLLLAPIGWSHGSIYAARAARLPPSRFTASGLQMLTGAAVTLVEGIAIGEPARFDVSAISVESMLAVAYLVIFGSMVAYTAYGWLLRNAPLSLTGTYAYVNPVVAIGLGTLFLGESLSIRAIVASGVILAAVATIVTFRGRLASTARPRVERPRSPSDASGTAGTPVDPGVERTRSRAET